jgi:ArsR family transcriptional regulator
MQSQNQENYLGMERNLIVTAIATKTDGTLNLQTKDSTQLDDATVKARGTLPADPPVVGKLPDKLAKDLVQIFKLLSDETRLRILYSLSQAGELHVRALCELLQLSQPAVSHHLGMLRNAGIVEPRRDGKHNFYRILPGNFEKLLMLVFDGIPKNELAVRFSDLDLSRHRPLQPR